MWIDSPRKCLKHGKLVKLTSHEQLLPIKMITLCLRNYCWKKSRLSGVAKLKIPNTRLAKNAKGQISAQIKFSERISFDWCVNLYLTTSVESTNLMKDHNIIELKWASHRQCQIPWLFHILSNSLTFFTFCQICWLFHFLSNSKAFQPAKLFPDFWLQVVDTPRP